MKALLNNVDGHVVHSRYDLDLLRRTYELPDERVVLAAHGPYDHHGTPLASELPAGPSAPAVLTVPTVIDAEAALAAEIPSDEFTFLYFGIIRPYKGVEDLVAAFDLLPDDVRNSSRLVLVGETWENWTAPLDAVVISPNRDRITVVNRYVTDSEVSRHFADADAVVLPYRRSSSSGPLHIAMSAGLPVIVSEVGGLVEAAGDYAGTTFTPAADPAALAEAMQWIVERKGERYTDPHSWDNTVAAYQRLFQAIGAARVPADGLRSVA
nr:glycosyltransferase [Nakamurella flavida]